MSIEIIPGKKIRPCWLWLAGAFFLSVVLTLMTWNSGDMKKNAVPLTAAERAWLKSHPVIRLAPDPDFPPVEYFTKENRYSGITADYVALLEKKLGIRIVIVRLRNWNEIISRAKNRQIDVYVASNTPQRARYMLFTRPFLEFPVMIITRGKVSEPLTLEKLSGMKVSVVSEYAVHDFMTSHYPKLRLDPVTDVRTGLRKVSFGLSDAFVENPATASYYIEKEGISNLRISGESGYSYRMGFGSRNDWPELNGILEKGLAGISDAEKKAIYKRWIHLEPKSFLNSREVQTGLFVALTAILLTAAAVIFWNRSLAREVNLRTRELENELAERRQAEEALRESEQRFRVLTETSPVAIIVYQGENTAYVNPAATRLIGYTEQECQQMNFWDWTHQDYKEEVKKRGLARQQAEVAPSQYEIKCVTKNGEEKWVYLSAGYIEFGGTPAGIVSIIDITELKRMEEELERARDELEKRVIERTAALARTTETLIAVEQEKNLFLNVTDALVVYFDPGMNIRWANRAACESVGMPREELQRRHCWEVWHQRREPCAGCPVLLARDTGEAHEAEMRSPDGRVWFIRGYPVKDKTGCITGIVEFCQDFTERKKAEEQLLLSQFCIDNAGIGIYQSDVKGTIFSVNEHACRSHGYAREELCSLSIFDIDPEITPEKCLELQEILNERGTTTFQTTHRRRDGSTFPVEITANHFNFLGKQYGVSFVKDITERRRAEEAILESRAKYQAIVDSFDGFIFISSQDYRIEFMNRKLIERTGRDAVGEYCYEVMNDLDCPCPWCVNDLIIKGETVHREVLIPKDNRWYYAVHVPIRHADGSMSKHSMLIDITERKLFEVELQRQKQLLQTLNDTLERRVEEEVKKNREKDIMLIQQNRQATLGEMLDHIAHQWKQPLNSIALLAQDIEYTSSDGVLTDEQVRENIGRIMSILEHMAQTIDVFRGFFRPDKELKAFSIGQSIDQALTFITPTFRFHSIAVEVDVDPGLTGLGYPREYAQVILNILANARDVFRARKTEKPRIRIKSCAEGNRTVVTITDNAGGIPEAIRDRIFHFHFTTNEVGGGTGIGLYMSKNIIEKNMGGTLSAENTDGGARFRIEIPSA